MHPALRFPLIVIPVVEEGREVGIGAGEHTAAGAAVATIGAALRDELLPAERAGAGTAVTGRDSNHNSIYEHQDCGLRIADCGFARRAMRAVLMDATVMAKS